MITITLLCCAILLLHADSFSPLKLCRDFFLSLRCVNYDVDSTQSASHSIGFSKKAGMGYLLKTHIISGDNALEHGVNMIEQIIDNENRNVSKFMVISGWNSARADPLSWELEPRGFEISFQSICDEPLVEDIVSLASYAINMRPDVIISIGGASVMDASKLLWSSLHCLGDVDVPSSFHSSNVLRSLVERLNQKSSPEMILELLKHLKTSKFISIPASPSLGAEMSPFAAILLDEQVDMTQLKSQFKSYIPTLQPSLCIYQPSVLFDVPMELLHWNIMCTLALTLDIILSTENSVSEYLAWTAFEKLIPVIDAAVKTSAERTSAWRSDSAAFSEVTMHDDLAAHESQYFRRFGQRLSPALLATLTEVQMASAIARGDQGCRPSPLQFLVDTISASVGTESSYTARMAYLSPWYFLSVLDWAEDAATASQTRSEAERDGHEDRLSEAVLGAMYPGTRVDGPDSLQEGSRIFSAMTREERRNRLRSQWQQRSRSGGPEEEAEKAYVRSQLARIDDVLGRLKCLRASESPEKSESGSQVGLRAKLHRLTALYHTIAGPEHPGRDYRFPQLLGTQSAEACHSLRQTMQDVCGDVPGSRLSADQIFALYKRLDALVTASSGESDLELTGKYEDDDDGDGDWALTDATDADGGVVEDGEEPTQIVGVDREASRRDTMRKRLSDLSGK